MSSYPPVRGMRHNIFFWTHTNPEGGDRDDIGSKFNVWEAEAAVRLARYLVQNGYAGAPLLLLKRWREY